jgi:hypothetical protein
MRGDIFDIAQARGTPNTMHNAVAMSDVCKVMRSACDAVSFDHNSPIRVHGTRTKRPTMGTPMTATATTATTDKLFAVCFITV